MNGFKVKGKRAQCPGHQGRDLSLSFSDGHDGKLLLRCFSHSCPVSEIMNGVGLSMKDLFPETTSFDRNKYQQLKKNKKLMLSLLATIVLLLWLQQMYPMKKCYQMMTKIGF